VGNTANYVVKTVFNDYNVVEEEATLMYRVAMEQLYRWKSQEQRKPLIIRGARQVGKTWLMKTFGADAYQSSVYISFDNNRRMKELFCEDLNIERIIMGLELYAGQKIDPANTLLIFDEIQKRPRLLQP